MESAPNPIALTPWPHEQHFARRIPPNVLDGQFTASAPYQKWVADFTYVWTREG